MRNHVVYGPEAPATWRHRTKDGRPAVQLQALSCTNATQDRIYRGCIRVMGQPSKIVDYGDHPEQIIIDVIWDTPTRRINLVCDHC